MKRRALLLAPLFVLLLAACGDDDGGSVTSEGGSESGSGSASASGSHASASDSGSGSAAHAECEIVGGTDAEPTAEVHATLDEWTIEVDTASVAAGAIAFEAENVGEDDHELVIVKGAKPDQLTITDDGLDEEALPEGAEVLGEIEGFPGGESCTGTFDLAAGDYTLVCNIVEESENEAHAKMGMVTAFTVTA